MNHDELLAKIDSALDDSTHSYDFNCSVGHDVMLDALRAVVELHKPNQETDFMIDDIYSSIRIYRLCCEVCHKSQDPKAPQLYPCPTIQAIEKELA